MNEVINFWFKEIDSKKWFEKDLEFDKLVIEKFSDLHIKATMGELIKWRETIEGRLAEIIILDQFSRNMFRDDSRSFAYDSMALVLAQEAISLGLDKKLEDKMKAFLYMPFMHSESAYIHELAVDLFKNAGLNYNLEFELKHKEIIDRFGRYPHRNEVLGRESTPEEIEFLKRPGSSF